MDDVIRILLVYGVPGAILYISYHLCFAIFPDGNGSITEAGKLVFFVFFFASIGLMFYFHVKTRRW